MLDLNKIDFKGVSGAIEARFGGVPVRVQADWMKQGRYEDLRALHISESIATCLFGLYAQVLGRHYHKAAVVNSVKKHLKQLCKFHNFCDEREYPVVLYLRAQVAIRKQECRPNALRSERAVQVYEDYVIQESKKYRLSRQVESHLNSLNEVKDRAEAAIMEIEQGSRELTRAMQKTPMLSREAVLFMEQARLPGAFLVMEPFMLTLYEEGGVDPMTEQKMTKAIQEIARPEIGDKVISAVSRV